MQSKRTKALAINTQTKLKVYERDKHHCVWCGRWVTESNACCHYIARSQGGLGIEQNILTLCNECHARYDNGAEWGENIREKMKAVFKEYLQSKYDDWNERELIYKKWG